MKKIGLIGGTGPESTVEYYKLIIDAFRRRGGVSPEIIIYSVDLNHLLRLMDGGDLNSVAGWLAGKIASLHSAGADFAAITANTPHMVFDKLAASSPIPLLSIVEETRRHAHSAGLRRCGLLGTKYTMSADFYRNTFAESGIEIFAPDIADQELIHHRLFSEIELGVIKDSTRNELLAIIKRMIDRRAIDGVILGCTELPLILESGFGIPFLNTTKIHVDAIVEFCAN